MLRVDEGVGHPVGDPCGEFEVAGAGGQDRRRPVGRGVLEAVSAAPPDSPAAGGCPARPQPGRDRGQGGLGGAARERAGPLHREAEPGDVVVVVVGPGPEVAQPHRAGQRRDLHRPQRLGCPPLGVDQAVQQVRLPPVVPRPRADHQRAGPAHPPDPGSRHHRGQAAHKPSPDGVLDRRCSTRPVVRQSRASLRDLSPWVTDTSYRDADGIAALMTSPIGDSGDPGCSASGTSWVGGPGAWLTGWGGHSTINRRLAVDGESVHPWACPRTLEV